MIRNGNLSGQNVTHAYIDSIDETTCVCYAEPLVCSVSVQPDGMESLITLSGGDMRRALNILQVRNPVNFTVIFSVIHSEYSCGL